MESQTESRPDPELSNSESTPSNQEPAPSASAEPQQQPSAYQLNAGLLRPHQGINDIGDSRDGAYTRRWLNQEVTPVLLEGMRYLAREKPQNPLRALGEFLLTKADQHQESVNNSNSSNGSSNGNGNGSITPSTSAPNTTSTAKLNDVAMINTPEIEPILDD